jgi:hypothetical protein
MLTITKLAQICQAVLRIRDPEPFCPLDPGSGMGKKSGCRSGMNNPDHFSESLETIFRVKILKFFAVDPGWKKFGSWMKKIRIRDIQTGSAKLLPSLSFF